MNFLSKDGLIYLWSLIKAKFADINHRHDNATTSVDGFMSCADKTKLNGIATGATANTGTVTSVATGVGLTGGTITGSGTVKAKLKTETAHTLSSASQTNTSSRQYAVGVDKDGYLSVNVPWTGYTAMTDTEVTTGTGTTARVISPKVLADYVTGKVGAVNTGVMTVTTGSANGSISVDGTDVPVKGLASGAYAAAYSHPVSGVTAGNYGPSAAVTGSNNTTINVPYITVDANGHVTAISNKAYTSKDTTYSAGTAAQLDTGTDTTDRVWPAKQIADYVTGKVDAVNTGVMTVTTGSANGNISVDGTDVPVKGLASGAYAAAYSHPVSGVTAGNYGPSAAVTGSNNTTINVPYITVDANGHVTAISNKVYTSKDTTYSAGTTAQLNTGTDTTDRVWPAKQIADYVNGKLSSVYKPQGSTAFANLPTPAATNLGYVWNITDAFTTTSSFVEGAGAVYPAGTNVMVVQSGSSYKFDCMSGAVDLSGYAQLSDLVAITNAEIDAIAV